VGPEFSTARIKKKKKERRKKRKKENVPCKTKDKKNPNF
jgi:hypothetical protein